MLVKDAVHARVHARQVQINEERTGFGDLKIKEIPCLRSEHNIC